MTPEEKKLKKYCNAVARRLDLPRDIKARVMSDFRSAIQVRQEAGLSEEEIYAEFGSAKAAAAELHSQMKEYAYRKSPWRWVFLTGAGIGGLWLLIRRLFLMSFNIVAGLSFPVNSHSVGIIGGADGPTAIFVTRKAGFDWDITLAWVLVGVGILVFLRLRKCKQK